MTYGIIIAATGYLLVVMSCGNALQLASQLVHWSDGMGDSHATEQEDQQQAD